jgi:hypothetical protein
LRFGTKPSGQDIGAETGGTVPLVASDATDCTALLTAVKTEAEKPVAVAVFRGNWRKRCTSASMLVGSFGNVTALTMWRFWEYLTAATSCKVYKESAFWTSARLNNQMYR